MTIKPITVTNIISMNIMEIVYANTGQKSRKPVTYCPTILIKRLFATALESIRKDLTSEVEIEDLSQYLKRRPER